MVNNVQSRLFAMCHRMFLSFGWLVGWSWISFAVSNGVHFSTKNNNLHIYYY
jgi:hypothetical protein